MAEDKRTPIVNVEKLTMWKLLTDEETAPTYDEAVKFGKILMTAKDTPSTANAELYGDGEKTDEAFENTGGAIEFGIHGLNSSDRALIYGEHIKKGTNVTAKYDTPNYVCVAIMSKRGDKLYNLKKYVKCIFMPSEESETQTEKGGIKYSTTTIKGTYSPLLSTTEAKFVRYGVDPVNDAEIINKWFTDALYIGPDESVTQGS